jgi:hypothetical protein
MGADGGVNWIKLKDPKDYSRVLELTNPLRIWYTEDGIYEEYHEKWLDENPDISYPNYIVGRYGSFRGYSQGADSLVEILGYEPKHRGPSEYENLDYTFEEVWLDLITREPWKQGEWARTSLEKHLWEIFSWMKPEEVFESLGVLRHMHVGDWFDELCSKLDYYGSCETWT